jgi:hypothetical protein
MTPYLLQDFKPFDSSAAEYHFAFLSLALTTADRALDVPP